jgi:hypothetical protein
MRRRIRASHLVRDGGRVRRRIRMVRGGGGVRVSVRDRGWGRCRGRVRMRIRASHLVRGGGRVRVRSRDRDRDRGWGRGRVWGRGGVGEGVDKGRPPFDLARRDRSKEEREHLEAAWG